MKNFLIGIGLVFVTMMTLSSWIGPTEYAPAIWLWMMFLIALAVPLILRFRLQKLWKKRTLYLTFCGSFFFLMIFTQMFFSNTASYQQYEARQQQEAATQPEPQPVVEESEVIPLGVPFKVGYMSYQVDKIDWQQRLGDSYFGKTADSRYLIVFFSVKNEDKQNRLIPPFTLVDENGATYNESEDRMYLPQQAILLDDLNPGVKKKAVLVFDVPPEHHYQLVVSGGYWSAEDKKVQLN